ncbi:hypothetical protein CL176_01380 [Suicoccus acidiformans]|uniref:Uncharacterized protein n=1 Tax=Suicoccus acidiformans TaxID=2036206 RepID=A0A347WI66_9LACT|nr:hypothetical protein [Suicoccus acidiformans]AXY24773.1 hypothetical protein CL176_01380 [Suicoccus acidiformans]
MDRRLLDEFKKVRKALENIAKALEKANRMDEEFYKKEHGIGLKECTEPEIPDEVLKEYII